MKITDITENQVIHCKTEKEAIRICKLMHEAGMKWRNGDSYIKNNKLGYYKNNICYRPKTGSYCDLECYEAEGKEIIDSTLVHGGQIHIKDINSTTVIRCTTESEAERIVELMRREMGYIWQKSFFNIQNGNICYRPSTDTCGSEEYYNSRGYNIIDSYDVIGTKEEVKETKNDKTEHNTEYTSLKNGISKLKKRAKQIEEESEKQKKKYLEMSKLVDNLSTEIKEIRQNLRNQMVSEKSESQSVENQEVRGGSLNYKYDIEVNNSALDLGDIERLEQRIRLMIDMTEYAKRVNKGWVPDWYSEGKKWGIAVTDEQYVSDWYVGGLGSTFVFGISVKTEKLAREMFYTFRDRIEKYH